MAKRPVKTKKYIDEQTGEIVHFIMVDVQTKDRDFAKVKQALTKAIIERLDYINGAIKLLILFLDMAIEQKVYNRPVEIYLHPDEATGKLQITRQTFYLHLKRLVDCGIIIKKRPHVYVINPEMIWIGTAQSYLSWLREQTQLKLFSAPESKTNKKDKEAVCQP